MRSRKDTSKRFGCVFFYSKYSSGKILLTYDDYCLLPNDRNRYEILDGELSVTPAPLQCIKQPWVTFIGFLPTML